MPHTCEPHVTAMVARPRLHGHWGQWLYLLEAVGRPTLQARVKVGRSVSWVRREAEWAWLMPARSLAGGGCPVREGEAR